MNGKEGEYAGNEKNENVNQILEGRQRATESAGSFIAGNQPIRRRGDGREGVEEVVGTQFISLQVQPILFVSQASSANTVAIHEGGQLKEVGLFLLSNDSVELFHIRSPLRH